MFVQRHLAIHAQLLLIADAARTFSKMGGGGGAQWANSAGDISITSLKSVTSANTPQSPQLLPPHTTNAPQPTIKPPPQPQK